MNADDACRHRLGAQFLARPSRGTTLDVVRTLGAIQAQDYSGAKWALGQRVAGATDAAIETLFTEGAVLRTHVLRPTWHFVAPQDVRWLLALTAPRVAAAMASYNRKLELTPDVFRLSHDTLARALEGGKHLTRAELGNSLARAGIVASAQRLGHLMMQAELDAVICSGPRRGKQFTYALLHERVAPAPTRDRDESLLDLTLRYFATRGPATTADMSWWSGLGMSDVRRGIEMAGKELRRVDLDGRPHWVVARRRKPAARTSAHLLPNYDEYFIGLKDRSSIGRRARGSRLVTGGDALIVHVAFIDGQLVGGWRRLVERSAVVVELDLVTRITRGERERLEAQGRRLATFLGAPVTMRDRNRQRR
jgi:Winged helix DNA-binding domain